MIERYRDAASTECKSNDRKGWLPKLAILTFEALFSLIYVFFSRLWDEE